LVQLVNLQFLIVYLIIFFMYSSASYDLIILHLTYFFTTESTILLSTYPNHLNLFFTTFSTIGATSAQSLSNTFILIVFHLVLLHIERNILIYHRDLTKFYVDYRSLTQPPLFIRAWTNFLDWYPKKNIYTRP